MGEEYKRCLWKKARLKQVIVLIDSCIENPFREGQNPHRSLRPILERENLNKEEDGFNSKCAIFAFNKYSWTFTLKMSTQL